MSDTASPARRRSFSWGWAAHWVVRMLVALWTLPYAVTKLVLMQMGTVDYPDLLITLGEKSPMGLLWTFIAYSPVAQFLAGLVEFIAIILVLWRRTAWLGGLVGFVSLSVVWLLNMTYDIPVKQLSLFLALMYLVVALPFLPRVWSFLLGRPTKALQPPRVFASPKVHRVTRWFPAASAAILVIGSAGMCVYALPRVLNQEGSGVSGVFRLVSDTDAPARDVQDDQRWQYVAFGKAEWGDPEKEAFSSQFAVRRVNGELQYGIYTLEGNKLILDLSAPLTDDERNAGAGDTIDTSTLEVRRSGEHLMLVRGDHTREYEPYDLGTTLVDRPFSWEMKPFNR